MFKKRYRVGLVFPFQNVFYFYFLLFSFLYFIHFCILLNCFSLRNFFYIKCLDPSLFPQEQHLGVHFFRLKRLYRLYEREGWVLFQIQLRRRHILVAHHLHGKTSRFTVEANNSKIQVIKGGKFHQK